MNNQLFIDVECPGCGCEPEITGYYRRGDERVGYHCTCGVIVVDGIVIGVSADVY